jgi:hypothetical protein
MTPISGMALQAAPSGAACVADVSDGTMRAPLRRHSHCSGTYPVVAGHGDAVQCAIPGCASSTAPPQGGALGAVARLLAPAEKSHTLPLPPVLWQQPPPGLVFAAASHSQLPSFYSSEQPGTALAHSSGRMFLCPASCNATNLRRAANKTHLFGLLWEHALQRRLHCPFW